MSNPAYWRVDCAAHVWTPTIGDPTLYGWTATAGYAIAAGLCAAVAAKGRSGEIDRWLWMLIALGLALLALNKQLDLHREAKYLARCLAIEQGWYDQRRAVQSALTIAATVIAAGGMAFVAWALSRMRGPRVLIGLGLAMIGGLQVLRLAESHHLVDGIVSETDFAALHGALELGGLGLLIIAATQTHVRRRPSGECDVRTR